MMWSTLSYIFMNLCNKSIKFKKRLNLIFNNVTPGTQFVPTVIQSGIHITADLILVFLKTCHIPGLQKIFQMFTCATDRGHYTNVIYSTSPRITSFTNDFQYNSQVYVPTRHTIIQVLPPANAYTKLFATCSFILTYPFVGASCIYAIRPVCRVYPLSV